MSGALLDKNTREVRNGYFVGEGGIARTHDRVAFLKTAFLNC